MNYYDDTPTALRGSPGRGNSPTRDRQQFNFVMDQTPNSMDAGEDYDDGGQYGQNNITVILRVRPLNQKEMSVSDYETIKITEGKNAVLLDPERDIDGADFLRNQRTRERIFPFDYAFGKNETTEAVFNKAVRLVVPGLLNGFNATVFAYGATGAGKTYTMMGTGGQGIIPQTLQELFMEIGSAGQINEYVVRVSYLEVYNEMLKDLLSKDDTSIDLREDPDKGIFIAGITEISAYSVQDVMTMLRIGNKMRATETTAGNVVSSRSHAVFQVVVEHRNRDKGITEQITTAKLSLIDLAGSEKAAAMNQKGARLIEGANINKSLLALGNCIMMLSEKKNSHIPYRDSKLTRLLKDSLGGNCRTIMIANVSPALITYEDTHNTLKFASRTKEIKTVVYKNVTSNNNPIAKYSEIINNLKNENEQLKMLLQTQNNTPQQINNKSAANRPDEGVEMLATEIKTHFDEEIKLKKKVFDLEIMYEEALDQNNSLMLEMNHRDDHVIKEKLENSQTMQRNLLLQINDLQRDAEKLSHKRSQFLNKINRENNKESSTYLTSLFNSNQMSLENMDLQHKEKKSEFQVQIKDRQIKNLQNQIAGERSSVKTIRNNSPDGGFNKKHLKILENLNAALDFENPFGDVKDIFTGSNSTRRNYIPKAFNPSSYRSLNLNSNKSKNKLINLNGKPKYYHSKKILTLNSSPVNLPALAFPNKIFHTEPESETKRYMHTPSKEKPTINPAYNRIIKHAKKSSFNSSPRRLNLSLTDESILSNSSTEHNQNRRARVLSDLNLRKIKLPYIEKNNIRNVHPHLNLAMRYGESPYVQKFNQKQKVLGDLNDKKKKELPNPVIDYYNSAQSKIKSKDLRKHIQI